MSVSVVITGSKNRVQRNAGSLVLSRMREEQVGVLRYRGDRGE